MAKLKIIEYPHSGLRQVAKPVLNLTEEIKKTVHDMIETMQAANGFGLAATQVNIHQRIVIMDSKDSSATPLVLINPTYEVLSDEISDLKEGCLSLPGFYEVLGRSEQIRLTAYDQHGQIYRLDLSGINSVCVQHEIDHLDGKLMIDRVSTLQLQRFKTELKKQRKNQKNT